MSPNDLRALVGSGKLKVGEEDWRMLMGTMLGLQRPQHSAAPSAGRPTVNPVRNKSKQQQAIEPPESQTALFVSFSFACLIELVGIRGFVWIITFSNPLEHKRVRLR